LQNNLLVGPIPELIGLFQLGVLDVSGNSLDGKLPELPTTLLTCDLGFNTPICRMSSSITVCGFDVTLCEGADAVITTTSTVIATSVPGESMEQTEEEAAPIATIAGASVGGLAVITLISVGGFLYMRKKRKAGSFSSRRGPGGGPAQENMESSFHSQSQSASYVSGGGGVAAKGTSAPEKPGPKIFGGKGKQVKLRLVSKIDSGGFGTVWKGIYEGREVAVCLLFC
jgi:hypothetical protein